MKFCFMETIEHMCFVFSRFTFLFVNFFMLTKGALFCTVIIVINIIYHIKVIARLLCYYVQMMTC